MWQQNERPRHQFDFKECSMRSAGNGTLQRHVVLQGSGPATLANLHYPYGVAVDSSGNVYVADLSNSSIRKITSGGVVSTLAGTFSGPTGVGVDSVGNVYVSESSNSRISKIASGGIVTTLAGGTAGFADGIGTNAQFQNPQSLTADSAGNIYVVDTGNRRIRKIS
jgi:sugar lactone lactonase YvrE